MEQEQLLEVQLQQIVKHVSQADSKTRLHPQYTDAKSVQVDITHQVQVLTNVQNVLSVDIFQQIILLPITIVLQVAKNVK